MSVFSSIKNWFKKTFGGSSSTSRASRASNYGGGGSRSYRDYSSGGYRSDYEDRKEREKRQRQEQARKRQATTDALASISKRTDSLASGRSSSVASSATHATSGQGTARVLAKINEKGKKAPPDPKQKRLENTKTLKQIADDAKKDRAEFNKATGNKYNVDKNGTKARIAQKSQAYDVKAEKYETEKHPIATSAGRGALSGVTFGGSEILARTSKNRQRSGAEAHYQQNKNAKAEIAGEIAGSLASFGLTEGASTRAVGKLANKVAPKLMTEGTESAVKYLAKSPAFRTAAKKEMERTGIKVTEEVIERAARQRATRLINAVGADMAVNVTTGGAMDVNQSLRESMDENGNVDWKKFRKEMGTNAALNLGLGGAVTVLPALRTSKGIIRKGAREDALNLARRITAENDNAVEKLVRGVRKAEADNALSPIKLTSKENLREQLGNTVRREGAPIASAGRNPLSAPRMGESIDDRIARQAMTDTFARDADEARRIDMNEILAQNSPFRQAEAVTPEVRPQAVEQAPQMFQPSEALRELDGKGETWLGSYGHITANQDGSYNLFVNGVGDRTLGRAEAEDYISRAVARLNADEEAIRATRTSPLTDAETARISEIDDEIARLRTDGLEDANAIKDSKYKGVEKYWERQGERGRRETELTREKDTILRKEPPQANGGEAKAAPPMDDQTVQEEAAQIVKEDFEQATPPRVEEDFPVEGTPEAEEMLERHRESRKKKNAPQPTAFEDYQRTRGNLTPEQERIADAHADALRAELEGAPPKRVEKPKPTPKNEANQYASIDEDVSGMGFAQGGDEAAQASKNLDEQSENIANKSKTPFEKQRAEAYEEHGIDLDTDNVEKMNVKEQEELIDKNFRTTSDHTKRGFTTIAVTGDRGFKGVAHQAMDSGETIIDVYHDKENLAAAAQRVMRRADEEGGVQQMIKDFKEYANGKRKLNSKETRDQLYDIIAAVDFANANKDEKWAEELFREACRAGAEQTSVSGLSLRMWQKMAMSSPSHRAKAVRDQILEMFNRSKGFRKMVGKTGQGNKITRDELAEILKDHPELKETLDALDKMGEATSLDEVQEMASKALLQARKAIPMTAFDQLTQWRYVAMLSSPKTHVRNITSNIYSATLGQLRDGLASGVEDHLVKSGKIDKALEKQGLKREDYMKSTGRMSGAAWKDSHVGLATGTELNSLQSKLHKAQMELETLSTGEKNYAKKAERLKNRISDLEAQIKPKQEAYDKAVGGIKRPTAKKAQEAWIAEGRDNLVTNVEKFEKRMYGGSSANALYKTNDKLSNLIGNALETSDAVSLERIFRERYDKILTANGWEALQKAAQGEGKEAKAAAARLKKLEEYAAQEASYIAATDTYRNYNALSLAMSRFVQDSLYNFDAPPYKKLAGGALHAIMPFTKVPVNLVKRGIDYSPIGLIRSKKALNDAISRGDITAINRECERLAEGRIGTGIAALGAGLGFIDPDGMMINTRLDKNDTLDKRKKDAGYQDYSIQAFGRNITMEWLTPTSSTLFTGVEFGRMLRKVFDTVAGNNDVTFDVADLTDVPINLASSLLEPSLQLSVFQGLNNSLENVVESDNYSDTNANPWLKLGTGVFGDYARSMIPTVLGQASRTFAPYDYFVTGDTDSIYGFNSTMSRIPILSNKMFGAKTNSWGQIKNEKEGTADYVKSAAKNLLSPANINKTTWDETDDQMMELSKSLGDEIFPKNNYNRDLTFGRNNGDVNIKMSNKELAEYNVQRGKSGRDAMADALNTVVFNRFDKDEKGHRTIAHADNITEAQKNKLLKEYDGKGIKEVAAYIINTPQFKKATPAEQKQIIKAIYGTNSEDDSDESKGAKRYAERYIAGKHGISADEYDYFNEVPRNAQELLAPALESGLITYKQALDFKRGAGKTYYTTDWRGEKGGTVVTRYNKKDMLAYLEKAGYSEEEAAALFNSFKQSNAKEYGGSSGRRRYGRRRGYRRWRHYGGGHSSKAKVPTPKTIKASSFKQGEALVSKKSSSSTKSTVPQLERVKAKIDLPTPKR